MDGLHQLTAAPTTIELCGGTYRIAPLTVGDYGAIERAAASLRDRTFHAGRATPSETRAWLSNREGTAHGLWLALARFQPAIALAWCRELVAAASTTELANIRNKLDDGCDLSLGSITEPSQSPQRDRERERPIPWRRIFRSLSLAYGWTPREIAAMSLAQLCLYLDDAPQPGETAWLSATEARTFARRKRTAGTSGLPELSKSEVRQEPFDALMTLAQRLRNIGKRLPVVAGRRDGYPPEQDDMAADRDVDAHAAQRLPRGYGQMSFATGETNAHAGQHRQTEILLRVDENLRRLRELVESRATAATALFADPL